MMNTEITTADALIEARMLALKQGDFDFIYESFHTDAPFLTHFPDRSDYLEFADQQLIDIALVEWKCLKEREVKTDEIEILVWMRVGEGEAAQDLFELALLLKSGIGWRYHSAQKLTREDYAGAVEGIDFSDFDQVSQKIRF